MKKKKLVLLSLLCGFVCSAAVGLSLAQAEAEVNVTINDTFTQSYELGETLNLMGGSIVDDGQTLALETIVTYPSGTRTKYSNVTLNETGEYKVEYFYRNGGNLTLVETKTFNVIITPTNLFRTTGNASLEANVDTQSYAYTQGNGVELTFTSEKDTVLFSAPIDFSDNTKEESFVEFLPSPTLQGVQEMTHFNIRLYDMNDASIWLDFEFEAAAWGYEQNLLMRISTSSSEGITFGNNHRYGPQDGVNVYQSAAFSTLSRCGVYGKVNNVSSMNTVLYYDATENAVYTKFYHEWAMQGYKTMVIDLDNPEQVSAPYVWSGFPSGKAYMEISVKPTQEAHMLIFSVDGNKLSGANIPGKYKSTIDVKAPKTLFNGVAGAKYPVFEASGSDSFGNIYNNLDVAVYTVSETAGKKAYKYYPIKNGVFETPVVGTYTMEYSFVDFQGNRQVKTLDITVEEENEELIYVPNAGMETAYTVGESIYLLDGVVQGEVGDYTIEKEILFMADGATQAQKVETLNYGFGSFVRFEKAGVAQVKVKVVDMLGRLFEEVAYQFTLSYPTGVIMSKPSLPVAVFKNESFVLPIAEAYEYKNGEKLETNVSVFVNNQNVTQTMQYTPITTDVLTVSYRSENNAVLFEEYVFVKEKNAEVYADNFFAFENISASCVEGAAGVEYKLSAIKEGNAKVLFIRKIAVESLSTVFDVIQGKEAEEICVRFTDSVNANESILCTLKKGERAGAPIVELYLNGSTERAGVMAGSIDGNGTDPIKVQYESSEFAISDYMGDIVAKLTTYENGELFQGFTSGYAYIETEFVEIGSDYEIVYTSISNQTFTNAIVDTTSPLLLFKDPVNVKMVSLGDVITAEKPIVTDVYSNNVSLTVKIELTKANGERVKIAEGNADEVDLNLVCSEFGIYVVTWTGSDGRNEIEVRKSFEILDREAPTLKLDASLSGTYSVGEKFDFPTATVEGDGKYFVEIEEIATGKVWACMKYDGTNKFFFSFPRVGKYRVVYIAYDSSMNRTEYEFNVIVK